jgi:hypothetical protein
MVYIPGSSNGEFGAGQFRALFPSSMKGPFGQRGFPLPNSFAHPAATVSKPYNRSFGSRTLTLNGAGLENGWGFEQKAFGKRRKSRRRSHKKRKSVRKSVRKSRKCRKSRKVRRRSMRG